MSHSSETVQESFSSMIAQLEQCFPLFGYSSTNSGLASVTGMTGVGSNFYSEIV